MLLLFYVCSKFYETQWLHMAYILAILGISSDSFDVPDSLFSPNIMESLFVIPKDVHAVIM